MSCPQDLSTILTSTPSEVFKTILHWVSYSEKYPNLGDNILCTGPPSGTRLAGIFKFLRSENTAFVEYFHIFTLSIPSMSMVIRFSWARSRSENATRWTISIPYKQSDILFLVFLAMYECFIPFTDVLQKYNRFVKKYNLTVAVSLSWDISSYMKCLTKSVMKLFSSELFSSPDGQIHRKQHIWSHRQKCTGRLNKACFSWDENLFFRPYITGERVISSMDLHCTYFTATKLPLCGKGGK